MTTVRAYPGIERLGRDFVSRLQAASADRGWSSDDLLGHLWAESGFKADALTGAAVEHPEQTASGLAQMTGASVRRFAGIEPSGATEAVKNQKAARIYRSWTPLQQLPSIVAYFDVGRALSGADFRLLGFARDVRRLSWPDDALMYPPGGIETVINPGASDDGAMTVGSVRRQWAQIAARRDRFPMMNVADLPQRSRASFVAAGLALGVLLLFRKVHQ